VANFSSDIQDCEVYAILLKQIAKEEISDNEFQEILVENDFSKRAEKVIEWAKRILETDQSIFVTPEDIISGNPRLNLAFAATLFHARPALGPSDKEMQYLEEQKQSLQTQAQELQNENESLKQEISMLRDLVAKQKNQNYRIIRNAFARKRSFKRKHC